MRIAQIGPMYETTPPRLYGGTERVVAYLNDALVQRRLDVKDVPEVYRRWPQYPLVSISNAQRKPLPFANWLGTVYHGLPLDLFRHSPTHDSYLAFVGRISPEKRSDRAIAIARRTGRT